jgi:hypothetical protein
MGGSPICQRQKYCGQYEKQGYPPLGKEAGCGASDCADHHYGTFRGSALIIEAESEDREHQRHYAE